jgi:hypothetical protein
VKGRSWRWNNGHLARDYPHILHEDNVINI